jgi:hypothetical protein
MAQTVGIMQGCRGTGNILHLVFLQERGRLFPERHMQLGDRGQGKIFGPEKSAIEGVIRNRTNLTKRYKNKFIFRNNRGRVRYLSGYLLDFVYLYKL